MSTLYIVGTPIGNLEDITLRALRILREASLIAAEDTRKTRILLDRYEIRTPLTSYFEHNERAKRETVFAALESGDVALVSEAGMPGVSDPGYELIVAAIERGVSVVVVPGVSAVLAALVGSGLPGDEFTFVGFLPRKGAARRAALETLADEPRTLVAYEAPHRVQETLADMLAVLGERRVCLARELTKLHEEYFRGTLREALARVTEREPRGEFTLVVEGAATNSAAWDAERVRARLRALAAEGERGPDAVRRAAAESGWRRRAIYAEWLALDPPVVE